MVDANGTLITEQRYKPFGESRYRATSGFPTDFQFTGQRYEASTGLYDYVARMYDPITGHFISADTVFDGWDRYAYTRNNPIRYTDPSGHNICDGPLASSFEECREQKPNNQPKDPSVIYNEQDTQKYIDIGKEVFIRYINYFYSSAEKPDWLLDLLKKHSPFEVILMLGFIGETRDGWEAEGGYEELTKTLSNLYNMNHTLKNGDYLTIGLMQSLHGALRSSNADMTLNLKNIYYNIPGVGNTLWIPQWGMESALFAVSGEGYHFSYNMPVSWGNTGNNGKILMPTNVDVVTVLKAAVLNDVVKNQGICTTVCWMYTDKKGVSFYTVPLCQRVGNGDDC